MPLSAGLVGLHKFQYLCADFAAGSSADVGPSSELSRAHLGTCRQPDSLRNMYHVVDQTKGRLGSLVGGHVITDWCCNACGRRSAFEGGQPRISANLPSLDQISSCIHSPRSNMGNAASAAAAAGPSERVVMAVDDSSISGGLWST